MSMNVTPDQELDDARRTLVALLDLDDDAPILDVEKLPLSEYLFLLVTCSATIIAYSLCITSNGQRDLALEGLNTLVAEMRTGIERRCTGKKA